MFLLQHVRESFTSRFPDVSRGATKGRRWKRSASKSVNIPHKIAPEKSQMRD